MRPKWSGAVNPSVNTPPKDTDNRTAVHDALACAYRRHVVEYLVTAEDNVAEVAELKAELLIRDGVAADRKHVATKLHHVVLPKLAALGFIEYDDRSRTVRYRESPVLERELRRSTDVTAVT